MTKPFQDEHWRSLNEVGWFGIAPYKIGYISTPSLQGLPPQEVELWFPECEFTACQFLVRFTDSSIQGEDRFLGLVVADAENWAEALAVTHERDINPGGTAVIIPIPISRTIPVSYCNRLLSKSEAETLPCGSVDNH